MTHLKHSRTQVAIVIAMVVAISGLRVIEPQSGPLYLIPVAMAALWLGRVPGLATGVLASLLTRATLELDGDQPDPTIVTEIVRLVVYGGLGYSIGLLSEGRADLESAVGRQELELEELRTLQQALAPPEPPERPALELATCYIAAEQGVSGDFYVVTAAPDGATLIAVGDVAGRGLEAAKRAWYVRTLLLSSADVPGDPAEILERANRSLVEESGFGAPFITAACMLFRPDGRVEWALAGHDRPLRLDDGSPLSGEGRSGLPLGIADGLGCRTSRAQLEPGSGVLLYTDGLTEARRSDDGSTTGFELFGERRIEDVLADLEDPTSVDVLKRVQEEVRDFSGGELADDLCMVALRLSSEARTTEVR